MLGHEFLLSACVIRRITRQVRSGTYTYADIQELLHQRDTFGTLSFGLVEVLCIMIVIWLSYSVRCIHFSYVPRGGPLSLMHPKRTHNLFFYKTDLYFSCFARWILAQLDLPSILISLVLEVVTPSLRCLTPEVLDPSLRQRSPAYFFS